MKLHSERQVVHVGPPVPSGTIEKYSTYPIKSKKWKFCFFEGVIMKPLGAFGGLGGMVINGKLTSVF